MPESLYGWHFLRADWTSRNGDEPPWKEGMTRVLEHGTPSICEYGYHAATSLGYAVGAYCYGPVLCYVRVDDVTERDDMLTKFVGRSRTLIRGINIERELRILAADFAEHNLPKYEALFPHDQRPHKAIEAARQYANGKILASELVAAHNAAVMACRNPSQRGGDDIRSVAWATAVAAAAGESWGAAALIGEWLIGVGDGEWMVTHTSGALAPLFADEIKGGRK